ncbi:hypothetical protein TNCV_1404571 [Trichonephila clavipes]|nr:hypothetical protein TNCV_1404571 [Trichonephila clavipes]
MLTGDVPCLATNPASNFILTIMEDVSGDGQGSVPILLSLLHATHAPQQVVMQDNAKPHTPHVAVWKKKLSYSLSNTSLSSQIARSFSNQASLGYDGKLREGDWRRRTSQFCTIVKLQGSDLSWHPMPLSPNFLTTSTGGRLSLDDLNENQPSLHGGSSVVSGSNS